jgi:hypothetical protein
MKKAMLFLGAYALLVNLAPSAYALTATGFMPGVENTVVLAYNSIVGVWIPALSFGALFALCVNCYFGFVRIATKVLGLLFGIFGLGAGLPWLAQLSGGTIATTFTLPL